MAKVELMRGHRIVESCKGHKVLQVWIEILVELIDHHHQGFMGNQVYCMLNASVAT